MKVWMRGFRAPRKRFAGAVDVSNDRPREAADDRVF